MKIKLNNREEVLEFEFLTISELLKVKKYSFEMLIIKINGKLIKNENYSVETIKDGDDVMVIHLMSGG